MRALLLAIQFLTRLPLPAPHTIEDRDQGRSMLFYPLVGVLLGGLLASLALGLRSAPPELAAALLLVAWVIVTGALHLDGLADSADAWVGGHGDRERTLAIMKDPRSGPVGVTMLVLVLLVKYAALQILVRNGDLLALALVPMLGRTALPLLFLTTPYVRAGGLGDAMKRHLPRAGAVVVCAASAAFVLGCMGLQGVWMLIATATVFVASRGLMQRRLGGTTGDTAGALVELTETACITAAVLS